MKNSFRELDFPFEIIPGKEVISNAGKQTESGIKWILRNKPKKHSQTQRNHCPKAEEKCRTGKKSVLEKKDAAFWSSLDFALNQWQKTVRLIDYQ